MDFVQRITGLITKPGQTMKDIIAEPRVEEALVIVAAYVILLMIGTYISLSRFNIVITDSTLDSGTLRTIMVVFGLGGVLVLTLLSWPIVTAVLHLFSMVFGGEGKFYPTMLTGIGYSNLPKLLAALVVIALATQTPVTTMEISSTGGFNAAQAPALNGPLYWVQLAVTTLCLLWSCYLGALAVKDGERLSWTNALIVVGVPLALYLVLQFGMGFLTGLV